MLPLVMGSHPNSKMFLLVVSFLPSTAFARRGGGGGFSIGGDSNLVLEPLPAAIFAFLVIFTFLTLCQAIQTTRNIVGRNANHTSYPPKAELSLGTVFPVLLFLSTWTLTTNYILLAINWAGTSNQNGTLELTPGFFIAIDVLSRLQEIFLVSGLLVLISHHSRVHFNSSGTFHDLKLIADSILMAVVLALGMSYVGLGVGATSIASIKLVNNLYTAYISFLLIAALDVTASSIILYVRTTRSSIDDHKIASRIAFIISPCLVVYALFLIIRRATEGSGKVVDFTSFEGWVLAEIIIHGLTEFTIIATCLRFWVSTTEKKKEHPEEGQQSTY